MSLHPSQLPHEPAPAGQPQRTNPLIWGAVLMVVGAFLLAQNLGILRGAGDYIMPLLFAGGGMVFGYVFLGAPRERWWAAIPAGALFGLAGTMMLSEFAPGDFAALGGSAFLGAIGLAFWVIYFTRREFWWAMIPGGVMITLAAVAGLSDVRLGGLFDPASVLFLGFGLTFLLVALSSADEGNSRWWAYIPAGVMLLMGFLFFTRQMAALAAMSWVWPVVLIGLGALLLLRALSGNRR